MAQKPSHVDFLVFMFGTLKEQQAFLLTRSFSQEEITEIWGYFTKGPPLAQDPSGLSLYQLHRTFLKQPAISGKILLELQSFYENTKDVLLVPDIVHHQNYPVSSFRLELEKGFKEEHWAMIGWLIHNDNLDLVKIAVRYLTEQPGRIDLLKNKISQREEINSILHQCVLYSEDSKFLHDFYYYLNREFKINRNWLKFFLLNHNLNLKVVKNIWSHHLNLSDEDVANLIVHPALSDELLSEVLKKIMDKIFQKVALFNALAELLDTRQLPENLLELLFNRALSFPEIVNKILTQNSFQPVWAWKTLNSYSVRAGLKPAVLKILKKSVPYY